MDDNERRKERVSVVVIVVFAVLALASLLAAFSYYCYIRAKVSKHRKALEKETNEEKKATAGRSGGGGGEVEVGERGVQVFSYKQLQAATGGFGKGNVVGHGSLGSVYRESSPTGERSP